MACLSSRQGSLGASLRREGPVVDAGRSLVLESGVRTLRVVLLDVVADPAAKVPGGTVLVRVDFLDLQAAEPALDHYVVGPAGFPVHALNDA